jgi:hypothetical protein
VKPQAQQTQHTHSAHACHPGAHVQPLTHTYGSPIAASWPTHIQLLPLSGRSLHQLPYARALNWGQGASILTQCMLQCSGKRAAALVPLLLWLLLLLCPAVARPMAAHQ